MSLIYKAANASPLFLLILLHQLDLIASRDSVDRLLIHPLEIAIAADKYQSKTIALCGITHEKNGFVVSTISAIGISRSGESWIIANSAWDGMQNISNLFLQIVAVD